MLFVVLLSPLILSIINNPVITIELSFIIKSSIIFPSSLPLSIYLLSNMDAKLSVVVQHYCHLSPLCHPRRKHRSDHSPSPYVVAVLSRSPDKSVELSGTMASRTVYKDNWFDRAAINHLSQRLQETTGLRSSKSGYDGLVEAAGVAYRKFNSSQQQDLIIQTLEKAFPRPILSAAMQIRALLPQSKFAREFFAVFTTIFFAWLVGPCEVRESEFDGTKEKNVVHIKKCRFLEGTNCVGMCTNLCKMSSQEFIKDSLGMPLNMVPNFDDMSCDMIFGQEPPLVINDPAFVQPCYKICKDLKILI
ncbi:unnamed protein product [Coffea canephora]|uniref:Beta-carotene isomerase D27-like C-terminal domain-containing protein n=1 Tax=Coffea canephora TaxID=49390 RepID=A0A068U5Z6_COFCA|nr:unnamed protein product [Coffea canephora]